MVNRRMPSQYTGGCWARLTQDARRNLADIHGIISLTRRSRSAGGAAVHQSGQPEQTPPCERAPTRRDDHERVDRHISPARGKREQPAVLAPAEDPILTPVTPMNDELEVTTKQWMEPVGHPNTLVPIVLIGCS